MLGAVSSLAEFSFGRDDSQRDSQLSEEYAFSRNDVKLCRVGRDFSSREPSNCQRPCR